MRYKHIDMNERVLYRFYDRDDEYDEKKIVFSMYTDKLPVLTTVSNDKSVFFNMSVNDMRELANALNRELQRIDAARLNE